MEQFIEDREKRYGGKMDYHSYAKYRGAASSTGTMYIIDGKIYYEDFEPQLSPLITYNRKLNYEKIEFVIDSSEIKKIATVSEKTSNKLLNNKISIGEIKYLHKGIKSFFVESNSIIVLENGHFYLFNFIDNFREIEILNRFILDQTL